MIDYLISMALCFVVSGSISWFCGGDWTLFAVTGLVGCVFYGCARARSFRGNIAAFVFLLNVVVFSCIYPKTPVENFLYSLGGMLLFLFLAWDTRTKVRFLRDVPELGVKEGDVGRFEGLCSDQLMAQVEVGPMFKKRTVLADPLVWEVV